METFKIQGTLVEVGELQKGTSRQTGNPWVRQDFVVETEKDGRKNRYAMKAIGQAVDLLGQVQNGAGCAVEFRIDSRLYNGRWYTELICEDIKGDLPF